MAIVLSALTFTALESATLSGFDFRAFYCAGAAALAHHNPYRTEPLQTCERVRTDSYFATFSRSVVVPSPVPGYDIALFAQLSRLPFPLAKVLWNAVLSVAVGLAMIALLRLTGLSPPTVFSALWLSLAFPSFQLGELIAVGIAAVCLAAVYAQCGRWQAAAIAATIALVEPHLGISVWLALFIWRPQTRPILLGGAGLLALTSFVTLGMTENIEYLTTVLPSQALSDLASDAQFSASVILHYLGAVDATALRLATIIYGAMVLASVYLAQALSKKLEDRGFLVTVPAAFALVGGAYIHVTYMAAALPLAMLLYRRVPRQKRIFAAAIILLSVPWWFVGLMIDHKQAAFIPMAAIVILWLAWDLFEGNNRVALSWATVALSAFLGVNAWYFTSADAFHRDIPQALVTIDSRYPEASWQRANALYLDTGLPASWLLRVPTWSGLFIVTFASLVLSQRLSIRLRHPRTIKAPGEVSA